MTFAPELSAGDTKAGAPPSIFTAIQELGLKLEPGKGPPEVISDQECGADPADHARAATGATRSGRMRSYESYADSPSFRRFSESIPAITGFKHVIPTH